MLSVSSIKSEHYSNPLVLRAFLEICDASEGRTYLNLQRAYKKATNGPILIDGNMRVKEKKNPIEVNWKSTEINSFGQFCVKKSLMLI